MTTATPMSSPAVLVGYDCWRLLETQEIARVAWAGPEGIAIVPVNYTVADGSLWFRTQPSSALARHSSGGRVAVEVDHLDPSSRAAWSVVVTGIAERVPAPDVPDSVGELTIWAPGSRNLFIRVLPTEVTGRRLAGAHPARP